VFIAMDEAVRASLMIPDGMTAAEAANQFCIYVLRNLLESQQNERRVSRHPCPSWLAIM